MMMLGKQTFKIMLLCYPPLSCLDFPKMVCVHNADNCKSCSLSEVINILFWLEFVKTFNKIVSGTALL